MSTFRRLPTLTQLRHLLALAEHEHFGRAAEACFITQSSLSASIKELETTLGQVLIERTKRLVRMTTLGQVVVARARDVVGEVEDIVDLVSVAAGPLTGDLRLGVIPTIAPFLLPRVLPALREAYPSLKLYLSEKQSADLIDDLHQGHLDLLLLAFPYPTPGLSTHIFADDPFWIAYPADHWTTVKERVSGKDLESETLLLLGEGHCLRSHALDACHLKDSGHTAPFQGSSLHTLVQMVDNGLGLTLLPKMAVDAGIVRSTNVGLRPLEGKNLGRQIGFAWRPTSPRERDYVLLADFFRDELGTPLSPRAKGPARKPAHP